MYRRLKGFSNYIISKNGEVYSKKTKKKLKEQIRGPYSEIILIDDEGERKFFMSHRLVYACFKGNIPEGMQVDHIDNNTLNNNIENLQLLTNAENNRTHKRSRPPGKVRVIVAECMETRNRKEFPSVRKAAKHFDKHHSNIYDVLNPKKPHRKSAYGYKFSYKEE